MNAKQWDGVLKDRDDIVKKYQAGEWPLARGEGVWWVLWEYLSWAYFAKVGADLVGWSLSHKRGEWLLCGRVELDGVRQVVFMSDTTTTGCVKRLLLRLENGSAQFYPDKFA